MIKRSVDYLKLLSKKFPTARAAGAEIINLEAICGLPKGTEYFFSDLHGEHEAFVHMLKSCSGTIKDKIDERFGDELTEEERDIVLLSAVAGLTSAQIAEQTGLQPGSVRSKLSRSLARMRKHLT